jgi:hypothetical protein
MQPEKKSDDIHTILSRFNNWSGKQNGETVQVLDEEVREIPYEEAIRRVRSRIRAGDTATPATKPTERVTSAPVVAAGDVALPVAAASNDATATPAVAETAAPVQATAQTERTAVKAVETLLKASMVRVPAAKKPAAKRAHKGKPRTAAAVVAAPVKKPVARAAAKTESKAAPIRKNRITAKAHDAKPTVAKPEEFRQVLAKSVRQGERVARSAKVKPVERKDCVLVPLSSGEKVRLRQCAAMAGVTVAVYLRMRALGMELPQSAPDLRTLAGTETQKTVAQAVPVEENQAHSGFGNWITLLRNRILASPARFAERA